MDKNLIFKKIVDIFFTPCKVRVVLKFKPFLEKLWIKNKVHKLKLLLLTQKKNNKNLLLLRSQTKTNRKRNLTGNQLVLGHFCPSFSSPATPLILAEIHRSFFKNLELAKLIALDFCQAKLFYVEAMRLSEKTGMMREAKTNFWNNFGIFFQKMSKGEIIGR